MATNRRISLGVDIQVDNSSLNKLKEELTQVQNSLMRKGQKNGYTESLQDTLKVANQLENILNSAWDSRLGQLDLSKVNSKMKEMGLTANNVKNTLAEYPHVWQSFSSQILKSNIQLQKSNEILDKMAITMANTVRYGISSSIFNRLSNSLSHAYNYAKNLDSSLNNIRIVSESSAESMEKFAKNANTAAKTFGSSTLDYTNAALIYYQQGLADEEIIERTNTTIKMANVLKESTEQVSNYMTAIWNNFDDGSESLEHYGDVITALGAATSSSSAEIADGLEKFSSVANTIGLSYDYATTALATVVAETRQSADVVGTAFRTLFSRIQGLNLGETLDDGTTLNKYSEALEKIGINIKDQSGNLKNMDQILDEMGSKWQTLNKDQQVALAQTVAGTRQYSQLIGLMDNWDKFQKNLQVAQEANGTLAKQQEIYLDSVEAHLQKLSTEAERTYKTLFDEDAVKSFADVATFALSRINDYLTGLGGGLSSLSTLGFQAMGLFSNQIGKGLSGVLENQRVSQVNEESINLQKEMLKQEYESRGTQVSDQYLEKEVQLNRDLLDIRKNLTQEQYKESKEQIDRILNLQHEVDEYQKIEDKLQQIAEKYNLNDTLSDSFEEAKNQIQETIQEQQQLLEELEEGYSEKTPSRSTKHIEETRKSIQELTQQYQELSNAQQQAAMQTKKMEDNEANLVKLERDEADLNRKKQLAEETEQLRLLAQGFSLLGSTITSSMGVISTLFNENLSGWEKFKSILSVVLVQGVSLIANWKNIGKSLKEVGTFFKSFNNAITGTVIKTGTQVTANKAVEKSNDKVAKSELNAAKAKKVNAEGSKAVVKAETAEVGANKAIQASTKSAAEGSAALGASIGSVVAELLPFIAIAAAVVAAGVAIHHMWTEDARAAEETAKAAEKATENYESLKNVYQEIKNDIKDYSEQKKALETLTQGTEEWSNAAEDLNDKLDELIEKYPELAKYVITEKGVRTLSDAGEDELDRIKQNANALKNSAAATKVAADSRAKRARYYSTSTDFSREMAFTNVEGIRSTALKTALGNLLLPGIGGMFAGAASTGANLGETDNALRAVASKYNQNITAVLNPDNKEEIIQTIMSSSKMSRDQAETLAKQIQNKENFKKLTELANSQDSYLKSIDGYTKAIAGKISAEYTGDKTKAAEEETERIARANQKIYNKEFQGAGLQELADQYLSILKETDSNAKAEDVSSFGEKFARNTGYNPEAGTIKFTVNGQETEYDYNALKDAVIGWYVARDTEQYMKDYGFGSIEKKYNQYDQSSGEKGFGNFVYNTEYRANELTDLYSKEDLERFQKIYNDFFNIDDMFKNQSGSVDTNAINIADAINSALTRPEWRQKQIDKYAEDNRGQKLQANTSSLIKSSIQGELIPSNITDNKDYKDIQNELENILKIYPNLNEEVKVFNNTNLVGTTQWRNSLYSIQTAINNINIANAQKKLQEFYEDTDKNSKEDGFQVKIDSDKFQDDMEALLDADYELTVAVSAETDNAFDQAFDALGDVDSAINKIQQGFQVSKEDIVALSEAIPGIAENYTIAANGLVQLDRETAKSAIAAAQVRAESNLKATKEELELSAQSFEAKAEAYDAIANIAQQVQSGTIEGERAEAQINEKLAIIQQEQDNETAINEQEASADSTEVVLSNTQSLMRADQDYTDQYLANAKMRGQAEEWAALGNWRDIQGLNTRRGSVTRNVTSAKTAMGSKTQEGQVEEGTDSEANKWKEIESQYRAMAEQMRIAASKARGQIAALEAFDTTLNLDRIGAGTAKSGGSNKTKDFAKDELDRYEKVNAELANISNNLSKIQEQTDKLLGKDLIDNLNQQIKLLNQQIETTKVKLAIANEEANEYKQQLAQQYGVSFGVDGVAQNYAAVYYAEFARYNSAVASYNVGGLNDEGLAAAEERYKKYNDLISKYDNMIGSTIPGLEKDIRDARDEIIEQNIEKFNLEIELRLETSQMERDWNEFKRKIIDGINDDDILGTAKARLADFATYYNETGTGEVQALTKQLEKALNEYKSFVNGQNATWYGDQTVQSREDLIKRYEEMQEALTKVLELQEELHQKVLDMMDETSDKFNDQIDLFEQIGNQINHNVELINLLTDGDDYEDLNRFYEMQTKNRLEELDFYTKQKDFWADYMSTLEEGSDEWEKAKENYIASTESWKQATIQSVQDVRAEFENSINLIFKNLNNSLTNNLGLDYINEQWTLIQDNSELYLDNINRIQGIQDLGQKYIDAINNTSSLSAQKRLNQLREKELKNLQEMDYLSQEDLDRAEKKLNLAIAQAAFEEAQYNKSQMRLSRDSQGNYRYVFTADQDAIDETRKELTAAYEELYNFDKDRYKANLDAAYSAWDEYQQKMAEAALINDPELRAEKEALITNQYQERLTVITTENEKIRQELTQSTFASLSNLYAQDTENYKLMTQEQQQALDEMLAGKDEALQTSFDLVFDLYNDNTEKFHNMSDEQKDVIETQLIPQWDSGVQHMIDSIQEKGGIEEVATQMWNNILDAVEKYNDKLIIVQDTAKTNFNAITTGSDDSITAIEKLTTANEELIEKYGDELDAVNSVYKEVLKLNKAYQDATNSAKDLVDETHTVLKDDAEAHAAEYAKAVDNGPDVENTVNEVTTPSVDSNINQNTWVGTGDGVPRIGDKNIRLNGAYHVASYFGKDNKDHVGEDGFEIMNIASSNRAWPYQIGKNGIPYGWVKLSDIEGYDTGGYTGNWNDNGRLAMLHQKELVLNADDTKNILAAVSAVRTMMMGINNPSMILNGGNTDKGMLEQNVHIEAHFPNVTSSREIEDALNNLVNVASQKVLER